MDKLLFGLGVTVLGMAVVFFGLLILIGFIKLLSIFTQDKKKRNADGTGGAIKSAPAQTAAPQAATEGIPADVVAAITAAIAAIWDGPKAFRVHHIKRVSNAPAWNRAGREEQIYSRL